MKTLIKVIVYVAGAIVGEMAIGLAISDLNIWKAALAGFVAAALFWLAHRI